MNFWVLVTLGLAGMAALSFVGAPDACFGAAATQLCDDGLRGLIYGVLATQSLGAAVTIVVCLRHDQARRHDLRPGTSRRSEARAVALG